MYIFTGHFNHFTHRAHSIQIPHYCLSFPFLYCILALRFWQPGGINVTICILSLCLLLVVFPIATPNNWNNTPPVPVLLALQGRSYCTEPEHALHIHHWLLNPFKRFFIARRPTQIHLLPLHVSLYTWPWHALLYLTWTVSRIVSGMQCLYIREPANF